MARRYRPEGKGKKLADIKGQPVNLVQLSVSHYLLARALESVSLRERDIKVVNTSTRTSSCLRVRRYESVVTWKPQLAAVMAMANTTEVFDRAGFPARSSTCWWSTVRRSNRIRSSVERWLARGTKPWP